MYSDLVRGLGKTDAIIIATSGLVGGGIFFFENPGLLVTSVSATAFSLNALAVSLFCQRRYQAASVCFAVAPLGIFGIKVIQDRGDNKIEDALRVIKNLFVLSAGTQIVLRCTAFLAKRVYSSIRT